MAEPGARYGAPMPGRGTSRSPSTAPTRPPSGCSGPRCWATRGRTWTPGIEVLRSQGRAEPELNATFAIEDPEESTTSLVLSAGA